ncbi:undecaprenyl-diphosphate phosphatase [Anaeromicrobium sediminis]|uniref:Undecaprenyl-diphosphatase n=1 Tax=Anaeromicrobium sediminis TaxID=1478221 RepID=A0A267MLG7_9FIRM|nr:undecaprenyl-diphosphate phosphatase [Anaeromicrobium sediminis]PAB60454.1 undecaprenyl-diphosphatase [Anaeromicrobium sediminis]
MSEVLISVILGIVEGLTEFLPVSSTGHLIIVNQFISFSEEFTKMFDVVIQLGAILSVIVYFWDKLSPFGRKSVLAKRRIINLWQKTIIGVIPALVIGALAADYIEELLFNPTTVAIALIVGGIVLILVDKDNKRGSINSIDMLDCKTAFIIGIIQCLAMIPGTSRSASTIIGAMFLGASRVVAAEFSFFLAIPTMVAASGYSLLKVGFNLTPNELKILGIGFGVSFIVALIVISVFMNYIKRKSFKVFGYYRIVLGSLVLGYFAYFK